MFGHYPIELVERLRCSKRAQELSKRAQELGFSLDEISELLRLEVGTKRSAIRAIAGDRLAQIERKLADLKRMQTVLKH